MDELSDHEILAAVGRGDQAAQKEFFLRYRQKAYRAAYRLLGNDADALDATSDAFVKVFRAASGFRGEASVKTWFYRIVVNTSLDLARKRKRMLSLDGPGEEPGSLADFIDSGQETPPEAVLRGEMSEKISAAIDALGEKHRSVFVLAAVEQLSYREIADALGISIGTVMSRLFYARKYLQKSLSMHVEAGDEPVQ
mgnify:CR=1 FL=1